MKRCFTFNNYPDCKRVAKFLQTVIPSTIHVQLGNAIAVSEENYPTAIIEGKQFIEENNITCNWIDAGDHELPLTLVPFAIITLNDSYIKEPYCIESSVLHLSYNFAFHCSNFLKQKVFSQIHSDGTIYFLIEDTRSTMKHYDIVKSIQVSSYYFPENIHKEVAFTYYFGNIMPDN